MEIEIEISRKTLGLLYKIFILLFFFGFSFWIFYLNYQTVQNYPIVFGDEGYHMRIAKEMASRKEYLLYLDYYKPNPPAYGYLSLFHFLEAFGFLISEWFARLLLPLTVFLIAFSMFVIFWKLFDEKVALISAILFQTFQSTVIYSVTFYVDTLLTLFSFLAFGFLLLYLKEKKLHYFYLSSAFSSILLILKPMIPLVVFASTAFFVIYLVYLERNIRLLVFFLFPLLIFSSVILNNIFAYGKICVGYWILSDYLNKFLNGSCEIKNVEYKDQYSFSARTEQIGSEVDLFSFGLLNYFDFAYGYSMFIIFTLVFSVTYIAITRKIELLFPLLPAALLVIYSISIDYFVYNNFGIFSRTEDTARYLLFFNPFVAFYVSYSFVFLKDFLVSFRSKNQDKINLFFTVFFLISLFCLFKGCATFY